MLIAQFSFQKQIRCDPVQAVQMPVLYWDRHPTRRFAGDRSTSSMTLVEDDMTHYTDSLTDVMADHLAGGFFVGWPHPPSPANHLRILQGSDAVVLARNEDGMVIGFITAISDGVSSAYIPHLEVLPSYQGQGIGSELVRRLLAKLQHLYGIDLLCDPDVQPFYARLGMRSATGMLIRNYDRQACEPDAYSGS